MYIGHLWPSDKNYIIILKWLFKTVVCVIYEKPYLKQLRNILNGF